MARTVPNASAAATAPTATTPSARRQPPSLVPKATRASAENSANAGGTAVGRATRPEDRGDDGCYADEPDQGGDRAGPFAPSGAPAIRRRHRCDGRAARIIHPHHAHERLILCTQGGRRSR